MAIVRHYPCIRLVAPFPGIALCSILTLAAFALERIERDLFGRTWLEALVLAILTGVAVRTIWTPGSRWMPGIEMSGKLLLEIAVVLLGASVSAATVLAAGPTLLVGIAGLVAAAIAASFAIGRVLGLRSRLAVLVACGNSICGNSAIAAVAPVIGADGEDVAAAIAFTAVLGVVVVLGLPLLGFAMGMSGTRFGALAGLTVYAVPQVIAAASPLGVNAIRMGTLVKLVRVLMLGPVCVMLALVGGGAGRRGTPALGQMVPWFIVGFLLMIAARSLNLVPHAALAPIGEAATLLTVVSMAALGVSTDLSSVARAGAPATLTACLSLAVLLGLSLALLHLVDLR
ncbi:MAG TPA: putative sulfate exporter family transporter [Sphingomonas sp.]|nr:putative sulfate exporter family transporter [Sphingomonas sp.]